jgi:hypothetical protein
LVNGVRRRCWDTHHTRTYRQRRNKQTDY